MTESQNPMLQIKVDKVTLNIGCGDNKEKIEKAKKLLEYLTGSKAVITKAKKRNTWNVPKGKPLGVMVTLRGEKAIDFLKRSVDAVEKKVRPSQFDDQGNFNIGIREYIDIPGAKYQHEVGVMGLNVVATLERAGFRIKRRRLQQRKIPAKHRIKRDEAMTWAKDNFGVEVNG
jgi:large subunit ribosomal protein L5